MMSLIMPRYPASVFSHRTAAWLHGFRQSMPTRPGVIVPRPTTTASREGLLSEARRLTHPRASALITAISWTPEGARSHAERRLARALRALGIVVVADHRIGPYRFGVIVAEIAAAIRGRMGGPRAESAWDQRPCRELYDDLHWEVEESFAREMGLFDVGSS